MHTGLDIFFPDGLMLPKTHWSRTQAIASPGDHDVMRKTYKQRSDEEVQDDKCHIGE